MNAIVLFMAVGFSCFQGLSGGNIGKSPTFIVRLEFFSGREDPEWSIDSHNPDYVKVSQLYQNAERQNQLYDVGYMPAKLGYRGFVVNDTLKEVLVLGKATLALQTLLLNSMPAEEVELDKKLVSKIMRAIQSGAEPAKTGQPRSPPTWPADTNWQDTRVKTCNNCYNYAVDKILPRYQDFGDPGRGGGLSYREIRAIAPYAHSVLYGALIDKLIFTPPAPGGGIPQIPPNQALSRHLVALVADPVYPDFHWYRLDTNGRWSHKPGSTAVTNKDENNNIINDPRNAANDPHGPDYQFVCFMTVIKNVVTVEGRPDNKC